MNLNAIYMSGLSLSAQHEVEEEVESLAEGRAEKINDVEPRLLEHGLGMAHGLETLDAVVRAHAASPDAPERKIVLRVMQDGVVDEHAARDGPFYDTALRGLVGP